MNYSLTFKHFKSIVKIFFGNAFLISKLVGILLFKYLDTLRQRKLIYFKNQILILIGIVEVLWASAPENFLPSKRLLLNHQHTRDSLNFKAHEADLNSDNGRSQAIFAKAGEIGPRLLSSIGIENPHFSFIGSEITKSIGHVAQSLSLRQKIQNVHPEWHKGYIITSENSSNSNYLGYWYSYFPNLALNPKSESVIERELWPFFESVSSVLTPFGSMSYLQAHDKYSREWEKLNRPALLKLTTEDKNGGYQYLSEFGFPSSGGNGKFVTLHVRNSPEYHKGKYLDSSYGRNANIQTYQKTVDFLIDLGYFVVRIGERGNHNLREQKNYLDFASIGKHSEKLNTFLMAECDFFIGTDSGPICVPPTFGKRVLMTNATNIGQTAYFSNSLMIPKLVENQVGVIQSLKEMFDCGAAWSNSLIRSKNSQSFNWKNNSEDEILMAVQELEGSSLVDSSIKREKFEEVIRGNGGIATANISLSFLDKWEDLLN